MQASPTSSQSGRTTARAVPAAIPAAGVPIARSVAAALRTAGNSSEQPRSATGQPAPGGTRASVAVRRAGGPSAVPVPRGAPGPSRPAIGGDVAGDAHAATASLRQPFLPRATIRQDGRSTTPPGTPLRTPTRSTAFSPMALLRSWFGNGDAARQARAQDAEAPADINLAEMNPARRARTASAAVTIPVAGNPRAPATRQISLLLPYGASAASGSGSNTHRHFLCPVSIEVVEHKLRLRSLADLSDPGLQEELTYARKATWISDQDMHLFANAEGRPTFQSDEGAISIAQAPMRGMEGGIYYRGYLIFNASHDAADGLNAVYAMYHPGSQTVYVSPADNAR